MPTPKFLKSCFRGFVPRQSRLPLQDPICSRLRLEILEDRLVPGSILAVNSAMPSALMAIYKPPVVTTGLRIIQDGGAVHSALTGQLATRGPATISLVTSQPAQTQYAHSTGDLIVDQGLHGSAARGAFADLFGNSNGDLFANPGFEPSGSAGVKNTGASHAVSQSAPSSPTVDLSAPAQQSSIPHDATSAPETATGHSSQDQQFAALQAVASMLPASNVVHPAGAATVSAARVYTPGQGPTFATPARPAGYEQLINRPTMGQDAYLAAKAAANQVAPGPKPSGSGISQSTPPGSLAPGNTPTIMGVNIAGANQGETGGWNPPDTTGAVGTSQFVETTNDNISVYKKSGTHTRQTNESLNTFFGYSTQALFDPRVVFDPIWHRFVVTADAFQESASVQYLFIGISQTSSATGRWWIYQINTAGLTGNGFFDYPMLGMDQRAINITANIFGGSSGAFLTSMSKAYIYNGLGFSFWYYTGLSGTLAATNVLDQNPATYLTANNIGAGTATVYQLTSSDSVPTNLVNLGTVAVGTNSVPPSAAQPGTSATLDSLDGRFQQAGSQLGTSLWQVFTLPIGSFPAPHFLEINTSNLTLKQSGSFFVGGTSYDFNPSIVANSSNDALVTWSATDPANNLNAMVRFGGRLTTDGLNVMNVSPQSLFTSSTAFGSSGTQRWGDYSRVSIDPSVTSGLDAWIVNEDIIGSGTWGSQIGKIGF